MTLPAGWTLCTSKRTGQAYYYQASSGRSVWADNSLPAGWGWTQASAAAPRVFVELASGEERAIPPQVLPIPILASATAAGLPQPSPSNVAFEVFSRAFRSREQWLVRQLAGAAISELAWWAAVRDGAPAAFDSATAGASDSSEAVQGSEGAAAAEACALPLITAALAVLGEELFVRSWDARTQRYVIRREAVVGGGADGGGGAGTRKRPREEASASAAVGTPASASVLAPTFRRAAAFPRRTGEALFLEPEFHSSPTIAEIYKTGRVTTEAGEVRKISAAVGPKESRHLYCVVRDNGLRRVLEVGCANGLSALAICQALEDNGAPPTAQLVSIDPFQTTQWASTALANLKRAGLVHRHRLIEEKSYVALPALLAAVRSGAEPPFDAAFVDGMHLFDYTLVDLFYADLLLRDGGVLLLDDVRHRGVQPVYDYVKTNWPHYELVADTLCADTLATFVKRGPDSRAWDFHAPFASSQRAS